MPINEITALKIKDYAKRRRKKGDADATIIKVGQFRKASLARIG
jgi:hypothetical protein